MKSVLDGLPIIGRSCKLNLCTVAYDHRCKTRQISGKLDRINTHINAINNAHEEVIDLFRKAAEEHDDLADIVLARIARKYEHLFSVWAVFIAEDITAVNDIVTRCNKFRQKLENDDCLHTRKVDKPCKK